MRIISRRALREFWEVHTDARQALQVWYADVKQSHWTFPADIKEIYRNGSVVSNDRVVFNIKGNKYRIVIRIQYEFGLVYVRFVGTHQEYDKIDATT